MTTTKDTRARHRRPMTEEICPYYASRDFCRKCGWVVGVAEPVVAPSEPVSTDATCTDWFGHDRATPKPDDARRIAADALRRAAERLLGNGRMTKLAMVDVARELRRMADDEEKAGAMSILEDDDLRAEIDELATKLAAAETALADYVQRYSAEQDRRLVAEQQAEKARAELTAAQARERVLRETAELLSRVGNRIVLTVPKRHNPHHRELERAVGLSLVPLAAKLDDAALRAFGVRVAVAQKTTHAGLSAAEVVDAVLRGER